ncbi:hypothetical protein ElyMa_004278100 [Elysia marginata]|uniref:Uncharacterized protein n=1 Tax=Elysia marginata TaxID=1093978 RepID=A0AAV4GW78_9GAST|nr:hypothetical protein ElyMa_004278100 [Elysia marginata]
MTWASAPKADRLCGLAVKILAQRSGVTIAVVVVAEEVVVEVGVVLVVVVIAVVVVVVIIIMKNIYIALLQKT